MIDDDEPIRRGLSRILSPAYQIHSAPDGQEGIRVFQEHPINAIILDIKMPRMSGFEVCLAINKLDAEMPIIFHTAFQSEHDLRAIINIYKPFAYLNKGGNYNLPQTVQEAVSHYRKYKEQKDRISTLEQRLQNIGLSVEDSSSTPASLWDLPVWINGKEISTNTVPKLEIRTFNRQTLVGRMPDADDEVVDEALEFCRSRLDKWRQLSVLDRLKIIAEAGQQLAEDASFDQIIPRTGWFSRKKAVVPDRLMTAQWMIKSEDYMNWACGERRVKNNLIEGIGTVGIIVQSSMFQTGAYAIIDALRAGNSILVKLDSRDPYSEYLVAKTLAQAGAPVQIISVDTRNRPHIGRKLIDKLDKVVFMGNPLKIIEIAYGEALKQLQTTGGLPSEQIRELQQKLLIPAKVISYTAHLGGAYVDRKTDLIPAVESVLHSFTSHYRACKRLVTAVIHPDLFDRFVVELQTRVEKLVVGEPSNPDSDIVQCSQRYWDRFIKPYLEKSKSFGRILYGEYDPFSPKIVELNLDRLGTSREKGYLGEEIMFPLLNIVKGDHHTAVLIADMMGQGSHDGRILEYSVFTEDDGIFKFFEHHGRAFNYHRNEPTTWGLGDVQAGRFRYHQRKILAVDLAGFK